MKQIKDKMIMTTTICTSEDGWRASIKLIGKSNNPRCFHLIDTGGQPPLYYREKNNA